MAVVMLQLLSMGFVMKTMPQINIMSIGFAAQIIAGLAILLVSIGIIATVSGDEIDSVLDQITGWVHHLGPSPRSCLGGRGAAWLTR
jgi:flagellar biosynthesis protein FliR